MESAELAVRARRAYEVGRWRWALQIAWVVLVLVAASFVIAGASTACAIIGATLLAAAATLRWRGGAASAAVGAGFTAGLVPFALLLLLKCGARAFCSFGVCMTHCAHFCALGGLAAGVLLAARAHRRGDGVVEFLAAGSAVAALTGMLGCFVGGLGGVAWMIAGELAATLPAFALGRLRRQP
jgi:hypothetical protein